MVTGNISDVELTEEEKNFVAFLINHFGTDEHPMADAKSPGFKYFRVKYAMECLQKANGADCLTDEGYATMSDVYMKLQAYLDNNHRELENI